jgi:hypothetical protein
MASEVRLIAALNAEVAALGEVVTQHFGQHPDADIFSLDPWTG